MKSSAVGGLARSLLEARAALAPRTRLMLEGPIAPTLLLTLGGFRLRTAHFVDILRVGALASVNTVLDESDDGDPGGPGGPVRGLRAGGLRHSSVLRLLVAGGGGWLAIHALGASLPPLYVVIAVALVVFGLTVSGAIKAGVWHASGRRL